MYMSSLQGLAVILKDRPGDRDQLLGYGQFLLGEKPRNYYQLADFLEWYGTRYLLPDIRNILLKHEFTIEQVIELGPGTGWLINSLSSIFPKTTLRMGIDKRTALYQKAPGVKLRNFDLEKDPTVLYSFSVEFKSLIIANHFLHCVDNPDKIIYSGSGSPWLVIEPLEENDTFPYWTEQMKLFGSTPLKEHELAKMFINCDLRRLDDRVVAGNRITLWRPSVWV